MINLDDVEARLVDAVHGLLHEAKAAEPAIEDAVAAALTTAGVPGGVADAVRTAVGGLIADYQDRTDKAAAAAAVPVDASPDNA
jgi:hypothetical protein